MFALKGLVLLAVVAAVVGRETHSWPSEYNINFHCHVSCKDGSPVKTGGRATLMEEDPFFDDTVQMVPVISNLPDGSSNVTFSHFKIADDIWDGANELFLVFEDVCFKGQKVTRGTLRGEHVL